MNSNFLCLILILIISFEIGQTTNKLQQFQQMAKAAKMIKQGLLKSKQSTIFGNNPIQENFLRTISSAKPLHSNNGSRFPSLRPSSNVASPVSAFQNMQQQSSYSTLTSPLSFGGLFKNINQLLALTKQINPLMAKYSTMPPQEIPKHAELIKTQLTWPRGYTKEEVERYFLRNDLKTKMKALGKTHEDFVEFRKIFWTDEEIKEWQKDDNENVDENYQIPAERENEANHWYNSLPTSQAKGKEEIALKMANLKRIEAEKWNKWRTTDEEIDEQKLEKIHANRKEIFIKALIFAFGQLKKLHKIYWIGKSGVDLSGLPREMDNLLKEILTNFMQKYLTLDEDGKIPLFNKNEENFLQNIQNIDLGKIKTIIEEKLPILQKDLQLILINQETEFLHKLKMQRKEPILAKLIEMEEFKLHFEMVELGLIAAKFAQDDKNDQAELKKLAKMKYYARKLPIVQEIVGNFAYGGLLAFGYIENEENEGKDYDESTNAKAELSDDMMLKMHAIREIKMQMKIMGYKNKLNMEWAEKMKNGRKEEIEEFMGRKKMLKSEQEMIAHVSKIYIALITDGHDNRRNSV